MSTFDTLIEWREGTRSDTEALLDLLGNLAFWLPEAADQEAYEGLCEVVLNMRKREDEAYYQSGVLAPNYPVPMLPHKVEILPYAVFIYETPNQMDEHITYLAFDYARSDHKIWG